MALAEPLAAYETVPADEYAVVRISDSGEGIEEEYLGRIFEPFFTMKKKGMRSGSGLGLSVVHGIVKDHDGFIDVTSEIGKGTTFSLYFPALEKEADKKSEQRGATPRGTERVLVVDDEPGQRFVARRSRPTRYRIWPWRCGSCWTGGRPPTPLGFCRVP